MQIRSRDDAGFIGEIFASFQGEGPLVGRRQVFVRFSGCNLRCNYCDTPRFLRRTMYCITHGGKVRNPLTVDEATKLIATVAENVHSISFTGGEPLLQSEFLKILSKRTRLMGWRNYLETNGYSEMRFRDVIHNFSYASVDVKLPGQLREPPPDLYENEMKCISYSQKHGIYTIAKVIAMDDTSPMEFERVCTDLPDGVKLVIQPVTPLRGIRRVSPRRLELLYSIAAKHLDPENIMVIPQVHRILKVR